MLLKATELLAAAGELPVDVRFAIDAEEEVGGHSIVDWVSEDTGRADVALVLDGGYDTETQPSFCTALRGICYFHVTVRTGERDLHSGMYGGAALPATHALMQTLQRRAARPRRLLAEPLRAGIVPPTEEEARRVERAAQRTRGARARGRPPQRCTCRRRVPPCATRPSRR